MMPAGLSALADALLHACWQGAAITALAWVATRVVGSRRSASTRFAVMHAAIWATFVAFVWTWAMSWSDARAFAGASPGAPTSPTASLATSSVVSWLVLVAWTIGASWHGGRLALGVVGLARWRRDVRPLDRAWHDVLASLQRTMGVARTIGLGTRAHLDTPVVFGVVRPVILVPLAWAAGIPTAAMRAALAHELAHVVRHDYGIGLAVQAIAAVFHFHPGVRWMVRELAVLRELSCDELAVTRAVDPLELAQALAELETHRVHGVPVLAANGAPLMQRIEHLVHSSPTRPEAQPAVRAPLVTAVVGLAIAIAPAVFGIACQVDGDATTPAKDDVLASHVDDRESTGEATERAQVEVPWLREPLDVHAAAIDAAARRHGVDPSLLAIVTWVESRGHADARSPMGARGLMQIMPATAANIARARGLADHRASRLDDVDYNLDLGAYHLAELIDTYGGGDEIDSDVIGLAAAAYNGGSPRVDAWLAGEPLPEETARYRETVVAMWQARNDAQAPTLD